MTITEPKALVAEARRRVENLSSEELAAELDRGDVVLVDLRESGELEPHGIIPGAAHIPRGMLEFCTDPTLPSYREELDPRHRIILYCAVGGRSALAAATLEDLGYPDVAHLDGGFDGWRLGGRPVQSGTRGS